MIHNDKYLTTVVDLQSLLLADSDVQSIYEEIVNKLLEVMAAGSVVIYEAKITSSKPIVELKAQAHHPKYLPIFPNNILYKLDLNDIFRGWLRPLRSGVIISGHLKDFDVRWQNQFAAMQISSFSLIPITLANQIQTLITIYYYEEEYTPNQQDINLFNAIANQVSAFLNRKNTEKRLLTYKRVFEESNFFVFVIDADGYHTEANFAYRQLVGYDTNKELKGFTPSILCGDIFLPWFKELKEKGFYKGEVELKNLGIVLDLSSYVIHNEDGEVVSYVNIANDITQRIQNEKEMLVLLQNYQIVNEHLKTNEYELLKREQHLRMLAENSFEMVSLSTPDGTIVYMSPSAEKVTGYELQEFYGQNLLEFFHPDDLDLIQTQSQQQITDKQENIAITHRFLTKSGEYIWLESFTKYLYDENGNVANLQSSSRDVTQNVLANKALKASEEKFRTLFDKTYDAIFIYLLRNEKYSTFIEINEVACKLLGYERQELLQLDLYQLTPNPEALPQDSSKENLYFSAILRHKNGTMIPVEIATTLIHTEDSIVVQAVVRDIREKKQAEEARKARELAEKLLKIKSDFLANMSHEIRTPMNGILGMTHFLLNTNLDEKQLHYAQTVYRSAENLLTILNDILDLSKLEANKMSLKIKTFDLQQLISQLQGLFQSVALQKGIDLQIQIESNAHFWILSDESRLLQVITNLVSNAIKFTPKGKVLIRISKSRKLPKPAKKELPYEMLLFEIIDEGIGISQENQIHLFDKFYQVDLDPHSKQQGTGLGLAICKQLVSLWEGEIGLISEEHQGSNFWFTMPLVLATPAQIALEQETLLKLHKRNIFFKDLNVLIAEDIFVNQEVAKTMIEQLGCTAEIAQNGKEAIEMAKNKAYDLILMDIQMPIMNGIAATKEIKATFEKAPIIIGVSANAMEEDAKRYIAEGMDDYISKPIEPFLLQEKLAKWFPSHRENTENISQELENMETTKTQNTDNQVIATLNETVITKLLSLVKHNKVRFDILLQSFNEDMQDLISNAKTAIETEDKPKLISEIHTIKGVSATIGTSALHEETKEFYRKIRNDNFENALQHIQKIEKLYQEASLALNEISEKL